MFHNNKVSHCYISCMSLSAPLQANSAMRNFFEFSKVSEPFDDWNLSKMNTFIKASEGKKSCDQPWVILNVCPNSKVSQSFVLKKLSVDPFWLKPRRLGLNSGKNCRPQCRLGTVFRIRIHSLKKRFKMLNHQKIILFFKALN